MEANKILSANVLDLLFEDRNKDYGAYDLRKNYNRRIARSVIITFLVALLAFIGSVLANNKRNDIRSIVKLTSVDLQDIKQDEKLIPPPPPPPPRPPQPQVKMIEFTPPVIKDEIDNPMPPQDELINAKIADVNVDGMDDNGTMPVTKPEEAKQVFETKKINEDDGVHTSVDVEAGLPDKWYQYLQRNCNGDVASQNGAPEGRYAVIIQFVVDKEGNISDATALTNFGYGMEQEAIRAIKKSPKWKPAILGGYPTKAYRKQQITFAVLGNE